MTNEALERTLNFLQEKQDERENKRKLALQKKWAHQYTRWLAGKERISVLRRSTGRCELCNDTQPWTLELHHIVPVESGKYVENIRENLIALCPTCHAVLEKLKSRAIEDDRFHDWIRNRYGEDGYEKFSRLLEQTWTWGLDA